MATSNRTLLVVLPLFCAVLPLVCIPAAEWVAVAPDGNEYFLWLALMFVFPALIAVPLLFVALIGLIVRRVRRYAIVVMLCSAGFILSFVVSLRIGAGIRMSAFHRLAERSKPLVVAIRNYEQKNGQPPESLQALVPDFIPAVPSTGMGAYPEYLYSTSSTNYHGNPWVLVVFTPSGGINFDQFIYFPLTNYPKTGFGGTLERVGDWAYVHE